MVHTERHRGHGVQQSAQRAGDGAGEDAGPDAELQRPPGTAPGAEDHHALEADVDHAGPLGPQATQAGEPDRHRRRQRRPDRAGRGEVVGAGEMRTSESTISAGRDEDEDDRQQRLAGAAVACEPVVSRSFGSGVRRRGRAVERAALRVDVAHLLRPPAVLAVLHQPRRFHETPGLVASTAGTSGMTTAASPVATPTLCCCCRLLIRAASS